MNFPKIIPRLCVSIALFILVISCHHGDDPIDNPQLPGNPTLKGQLSFSIGDVIPQSSGQLTEAVIPAFAIVTVHDADGKTTEDHKKLTLTPINGGYGTEQITIEFVDGQKFNLTEFLVLDAANNVLYATPKKGSNLAHFAAAPLDMEFSLTANQLTTINPDVVTIEHSVASDFGYTEFGFNVIEKIEVVISAFIPWNDDLQLTNAHLKIEGLKDSTSASPEVLWTYETDVDAKANTVSVKKSTAFRVTVTKPGFDAWDKLGGLKQGRNVKAELTSPVDVYMAGMIWDEDLSFTAVLVKNGTVTKLETNFQSVATDVALQGPNVYVTGSMLDANGFWKQAVVWRNGVRVDMPLYGETKRVLFSKTEDLYIAGTFYANTNPSSHSTGFYLKNGTEHDLAPLTPNADAKVLDMAVTDDNSVFIVGYEVVDNLNKPLIWHDDVAAALPVNFLPTSITIKNDIVYISGRSDSKAGYLSDGNLHTFNGYSDALDLIATTNNDVYVLDLRGVYWKNGEKVTLPGTLPSSFAFSLVDDHVYVVGTLDNRVTQWIDGDQPIKGDENVTPFGVTVVKK